MPVFLQNLSRAPRRLSVSSRRTAASPIAMKVGRSPSLKLGTRKQRLCSTQRGARAPGPPQGAVLVGRVTETTVLSAQALISPES